MNLHVKLGHRSAAYMKQIISDDPDLLRQINDLRKLDFPIFCQVCHAAKSHTTRRLRENPLATYFGSSLHADFKIYTIPTQEGHICLLGIADAYTRYTFVRPLKDRSGLTCAKIFREYFDYIIAHPDFELLTFNKSTLTVDNAKELNSPEMREVCKEYGLNLRTTNEYRHQDNGLIESFWRNESFVRAAIIGAPHVGRRVWQYAWQYITYIHNRSRTRNFRTNRRYETFSS